MNWVIQRSCRIILVVSIFSLICLSAHSANADFPPPQTDSFNDAQHLRWAIYAYTVRPSISQQYTILYDQINNAVDKRAAIVSLATTVFNSTLSIKSLLNPNITDFDLLTTTIGAELDFVGTLSGWDVEAEIADMFVAGLKTSLGNPTAFAAYCSTKTVSSIIKLYDALEHWKLAEKINLASALNELLYNFYAFGGDLDQIKEYYNIDDAYCIGTSTDIECVVKYFSETLRVDYDKLYDAFLGNLRYINRTYSRLVNLSAHIPSIPALYDPPNGVNPDHITLAWGPSECEFCGNVGFNLEVHRDGVAVFKADDDLGYLLNQTSLTLPHPLEPNTTYWWAVFPKSQYGIWNLDVGDWSSFTTGPSGANRQPVALFTLSPEVGYPATVFNVNADPSYHPDGTPLQYRWNWGDNAGFTGWSTTLASSHQYFQPGQYTITLCVTDGTTESYFSKSVLVWQAHTPPAKVINQAPQDNAIRQSTSTLIQWIDGGGATAFDVYFGTSPAMTASDRMTTTTDRQFDPGSLEYDTTYYWRIDAVNTYGTTTGDVWTFTTSPPPPWLTYHYWDFDTDGAEGWSGRNAISGGVYNQEYWIIDPVPDPASKSGIISAPNLTALHTSSYDTLEIRAAVQNAFINPLDAYLYIDSQWRGPFSLEYISGSQAANSQCVYRGTIPYAGPIEQVRIDFAWGTDGNEDRVFIDRVSFLQLAQPATVVVSGYVRNANGTGIGGVVLNFNNGAGSAVTEDTGFYHHVVPEGWSGTVVPSKPLYSFQPGEQVFSALVESETFNVTGFAPQNIDTQRFYVGSAGAYDGFLISHGFDDYIAIQDADTAGAVSNPDLTTMLTVGQDQASSGEYYVFRSVIPFDTSDLPVDGTIVGATLYLYAYGPDYSDTDFNLHIVAGPPSATGGLSPSDFGNFSAVSGGFIAAGQWQGNNGVNAIPLNAVGLGLIEPGGITIFGLRSGRDMGQQVPIGHEFLNIWSAQAGDAFRPCIEVDYIAYEINLSETVSGTVVDQRTGLPAEGAVVTLNGQQVITQADGTYTIDADAGQFDMTCAKTGYQTVTRQDVVIQPGQDRQIDFELPVNLYGIVTDGLTGDVLYNVLVETDAGLSTTSKLLGDYAFGSMEPGLYDITFSHQDFPSLTLENVEIVADESLALDAGLTAPLSGTVADLSTGSIIAAAVVSTNLGQTTQTDNHGHYRFASLNPGVYQLTVAKTGYQTATLSTVVIVPGETLTQNVQLTTPGLLNITSSAMPPAETTEPYNARVQISGGSFPYIYTLTGGMLPPGLALDADYGNIFGTPTTPGAYTFMVRVTDLLGADAQREFTIQVTEKLTIVTPWLLAPGTRGGTYLASIDATGGAPGYTFAYIAGNLPAGVSLSSSGSLAGTPQSNGAYDFTVLVSDTAGRTADKSFHLEVAEALVITTNRLNNGIVGQVFNQLLTASGGSGDVTWQLYAGTLPDGLTLDASSGVLSGTPLVATYGTIVLSVSDSQGRRTYKDLTLQVCEPLAFVTGQLPDALVGTAYAEAILLTGGIRPYTYSAAGQLPPGLSLNTATGVISGVPDTAGVYNVGITVTDSTWSTTQSTTLTMSLQTSGNLTIITSAVLPPLQKENPMDPLVIAAGGGAAPYTWRVVDGYLPSGILLTPDTGVLSGTPADSGDFVFTIEVRDDADATARKTFYIHVSGDLAIVTGDIPDGAVGEDYNFTFESNGGVLPYTWRIVSGTLPDGIVFNSATGTLTGLPTTRQTYSFTVEVSDGDAPAQTATATYLIDILYELYIYTPMLPAGRIDHPYMAELKAVLGSPPYTWRVSSGILPTGLMLATLPDLATLEGTPTEVGAFTFTLEVSDTGTPVKTAYQTYTVEIFGGVFIETHSLKNATRGVPYSDTILSSGGRLPYTWQIIEGRLPAGLCLNATTGYISGVTQLLSGQSSEFTIRVFDAAHPIGYDQADLVIFVGDPLFIETDTLQDAAVGYAYEATLEGEGGLSPHGWYLHSGNLPPGLTLDADTGVISGTATNCGSYDFTIRLEDAAALTITTTKAFTLSVIAIGDSDCDGILDTTENASCTDPDDADTDDDGIQDGLEDANQNGTVDVGETSPCLVDTDGDGIQDGTEKGLTANDVGPDTDLAVFVPDADPASTTNPLLADTDRDGVSDGDEDFNHNGEVDGEESDPNFSDHGKAMPWIHLLLLGN